MCVYVFVGPFPYIDDFVERNLCFLTLGISKYVVCVMVWYVP